MEGEGWRFEDGPGLSLIGRPLPQIDDHLDLLNSDHKPLARRKKLRAERFLVGVIEMLLGAAEFIIHQGDCCSCSGEGLHVGPDRRLIIGGPLKTSVSWSRALSDSSGLTAPLLG